MRGLWILAAVLAFSVAARGDEKLPAFVVRACTGEFDGTEINPADKAGAKPIVVVFVAADKFDRPIARYLRALDEKLTAGLDGLKDVTATTVWLTDDAAKSKEYLPKAQLSLKLERTTWTVFEGEKAGPKGWNVDIASHVTAVIVRDGKELKRFAYGSTNETDVPELLAALREVSK